MTAQRQLPTARLAPSARTGTMARPTLFLAADSAHTFQLGAVPFGSGPFYVVRHGAYRAPVRRPAIARNTWPPQT
jgi:hypothetical protein